MNHNFEPDDLDEIDRHLLINAELENDMGFMYWRALNLQEADFEYFSRYVPLDCGSATEIVEDMDA